MSIIIFINIRPGRTRVGTGKFRCTISVKQQLLRALNKVGTPGVPSRAAKKTCPKKTYNRVIASPLIDKEGKWLYNLCGQHIFFSFV